MLQFLVATRTWSRRSEQELENPDLSSANAELSKRLHADRSRPLELSLAASPPPLPACDVQKRHALGVWLSSASRHLDQDDQRQPVREDGRGWLSEFRSVDHLRSNASDRGGLAACSVCTVGSPPHKSFKGALAHHTRRQLGRQFGRGVHEPRSRLGFGRPPDRSCSFGISCFESASERAFKCKKVRKGPSRGARGDADAGGKARLCLHPAPDRSP